MPKGHASGFKPKRCEECGEEFTPTGPASRFCSPCATKRRREKIQSHRVPRAVKPCPACGVTFTGTARQDVCSPRCGREREGTKRCSRCQEVKPLTEFGVDARRGDGYSTDCRPCRADKQRERYRKDPERYRATARLAARRFRLREMGWDEDLYERMVNDQGGKCAMCGHEPEGDFFLAIDHDHESGAVRGLLCVPCNLVIGNARDDVRVLRAAITYLERHRREPV